jgi:excisionase family DNA binding protein
VATELAKLLTADDVGNILGKHPRIVLDLVRRGELTAVRLGHRSIRFQGSDVQDYIDAHRIPAEAYDEIAAALEAEAGPEVPK